MAFFRAVIISLLLVSCFGSISYAKVKLTNKQAVAFRSWMTRIIYEQFRRGPTPRWFHRDCAGLVRFAAYEAMKKHDQKWLQVNGVSNRYLPPEVYLQDSQKGLLNQWKTKEKKTSSFVSAIILVQENSQYISKDFNSAQVGDLIFFDQGESQHLMVWMGSYIAYHTGTVTKSDNGLRKVQLHQLMNWRDTRWQPKASNPNFIGIFRLSFLP